MEGLALIPGETEAADPAPGHSQGVIITSVLSAPLHTHVPP